MKNIYIYFQWLIMLMLIGNSGQSLGSGGKSCSTNVTVNVSLSCSHASPANATVTMSRHSMVTPPPAYDSVYTGTTDLAGIAHFIDICNGIYDVSVTDFGYDTTTRMSITVAGNMSINMALRQLNTPPPSPPGLFTDDRTLASRWEKPHYTVPILTETWTTSSFSTNQWTVSGSAGTNWVIPSFGYPSPSVQFNGTPMHSGYDGYLTSKVLTGLHSPVMTLAFDIFLDNTDVANVNTLALELWNGISWTVLKTYTNQGGSIIWSRDHLDIAAVTNQAFRIRFHASGTNSSGISHWNIDNIAITAEALPGDAACIQGYNYYLNDSLIASIPDTFYSVPPSLVTYGVGSNACVQAIYDSGLSAKICSSFTSHYLCPVTDLQAIAVTNAAYMSWRKPQCQAGQNMCFIFDDGSMENGWGINPGYTDWIGNKFNIAPGVAGYLKSFDILWFNNSIATLQPFRIDVFSMAGVLLSSSQTFTVPVPAPVTFMKVTLANEIPFNGPFYGMLRWGNFSGPTHWLGFDTNGPYASANPAYYYDGTQFTQMNLVGGGSPGAFTERACGVVFDGVMDPGSPNTGTGLVGYNVYHVIDNHSYFHHYVPGPDSLKTFCFNLEPGEQCFDVKAKYDLSGYGFPGTFGESLPEDPGPACVDLIYCCILPFEEPWDGGSLGYQQWINSNNWYYTPINGNPAPCAAFTSQPVITNYNSSLKSHTLDLSSLTCATIWLDFDYKLDDRDATGTEKMDIEVYWNHAWHLAAELANNGSVNWTPVHLDISGAEGKQMNMRFRANGASSQHIENWYFDNIRIYPICRSPSALASTHSRDTIYLTWDRPQCGPLGQSFCFQSDDGTAETGWAITPGMSGWLGNLFPVADSVSGNITSFEFLWNRNSAATSQDLRIDVFSQEGIFLGSSQSFQVPVPPPAAFVTITLANDIPFKGSFYGMVRWNNFSGPTNYLGFDQNGPNASQNLAYYYDGTTFSPVSTVSGIGVQGIFTERACGFTFQGTNAPDSTELKGYNIFRYDSAAGGVVNFHKLNIAPLTINAYTDITGIDTSQTALFRYFVTAISNNSVTETFICESPGSDTVGVHFPDVGVVGEITGGSILIYPNPARDVIYVKSDFSIIHMEVINYLGQAVYMENSFNTKLARINTSSLLAGVYFVKVTTSKGIRISKITVIR